VTYHAVKYGPNTLDKIAALWAANLSTTIIGQRLKIPKNSVCRLAHKARLGGDARFPVRGFRSPEIVYAKPLVVNRLVKRRAMPKPKPRPKPIPVRVGNPAIHELRPHECRYPVTAFDADRDAHRFCAKRQREGSAYCPEHWALCNSKTHGAATLTTWAKT
jgi:hypothetical protein